MTFSTRFKPMALAIATLAMGLGFSNLAPAQDATLNVTGQLTNSTCNLKMTAGTDVVNGASGANATRTMNLGTQTYTSNPGTANITVGNKSTVKFELTNAAGAACSTFSGLWNIALNLTDAQIASAGSDKAIVNSISSASGGTNLGVALFGGTATDPTTRLNLISFKDYGNATKVVTSNQSSTVPLYIGAQFVTTSSSAPTVGQFTASIPLIVLYD